MDMDFIREALEDCESVVDLGCGPNTPMQRIPGKRMIGVDAHAPSVEASRAKNLHDSYFVGTAEDFLRDRGPKSVDGIVMLDVIEHFYKEDGLKLLAVAEKVARKKIVLFTPSGFVPQPPAPDNPWQEHKSGWTARELNELGYKVVGTSGWKPMRGMYARWRKPRLFCAVVGRLSQPIVRHFPEHAFALSAAKTLS